MLKNRFYAGIMMVKGEDYPHHYPKLVDEWLFAKCQEVRESWGKKPFKYAAKPFVFRGLITCDHCGHAITTERKKGKYHYLFCTKYRTPDCPQQRIKEEDLLSQVQSVFSDLTIPANIAADIKKQMHHSLDAKRDYHDAAIANIQKEYRRVQKQLDALLELRMDNEISKQQFKIKSETLKDKQHELDVQQKLHTAADKEFAITVSHILDLCSRANELFASAKPDQKRQLINFVLWNLRLRDNKLLYEVKSPFDGVLAFNKHPSWFPGRDSNPDSELQRLLSCR